MLQIICIVPTLFKHSQKRFQQYQVQGQTKGNSWCRANKPNLTGPCNWMTEYDSWPWDRLVICKLPKQNPVKSYWSQLNPKTEAQIIGIVAAAGWRVGAIFPAGMSRGSHPALSFRQGHWKLRRSRMHRRRATWSQSSRNPGARKAKNLRMLLHIVSPKSYKVSNQNFQASAESWRNAKTIIIPTSWGKPNASKCTLRYVR